MKTILIVDDEFDARSSMELLFELERYQVIAAQNGEVALKKIAQHKPQIILTDWMMPVMDGFELCRRVRGDSETKNIPIIMMTAAPSGLRLKEKLWDALMTKPVAFDELLTLVSELTSSGATSSET
jgi:CheY-like chemotaxis protein